MTTDQAEDRVERQAREFELLKPYLVERWNAARHGGRRMSPRSPLPARILIPVANPGTAEELIRLGAAMLDPRVRRAVGARHRRGAGGDAAVRGRDPRPPRPAAAPEGPRLRARRARPSTRSCASAGMPPRASSRPSAEQEADLIIFGWGGKAPAGRDGRNGGPTVFSPTIDEVVRESPCDIAVVKQRGARDIKRILVPVRGGPHAELAIRFADAIATYHDATVVVLHLVPPGITMAVRAQAERALATFVKQHLKGKGEAVLREAPNVRNAILREAEQADLVVMGASASPGGDGRRHRTCSGRCRRPSPRGPSRRVVVVKTREAIGRPTFEQLAVAGGDAGRRGPGRRGGPRRPGPRRALVRRVELPPRRVRRPAAARPAQGEAGRHGLASSCRRSTRRRRSGRSSGARCARWSGACRCSTRSSSSTPRRPTGPARSPRPRARASSSTPTCCRATARSGARARRSGSRCTRRPATSSCGPTPT